MDTASWTRSWVSDSAKNLDMENVARKWSDSRIRVRQDSSLKMNRTINTSKLSQDSWIGVVTSKLGYCNKAIKQLTELSQQAHLASPFINLRHAEPSQTARHNQARTTEDMQRPHLEFGRNTTRSPSVNPIATRRQKGSTKRRCATGVENTKKIKNLRARARLATGGFASPPLHGEGLVVPVLLGAHHVDVGVDPGL